MNQDPSITTARSATTDKMALIDSACTDLSAVVSDLHARLGILYDKIHPVLGPDYKQSEPGRTVEEAQPEMSPLLKYIVSETERIRYITIGIQDHIDRVEC